MSGGGLPIPERIGSVPLLQDIRNVNPNMYHEVNHTITKYVNHLEHVHRHPAVN